MQAHVLEVFLLAKIVFYPKIFYYPLLLPSHNCIIIKQCSVFKVHLRLMSALHSAFALCSASFSTFKFLFQETQWNLEISFAASVSFFIWWRVPGSNRWPPACKAGALPAELTPHIEEVVGQNGLEPSTSRLSVVCSSQLSYWPISFSTSTFGHCTL